MNSDPLSLGFGIQYPKWTFQEGRDIYPGDVWCNPQIPHAKWHLQSGVGLLDLVYICDNVLKLTAPLTK